MATGAKKQKGFVPFSKGGKDAKPKKGGKPSKEKTKTFESLSFKGRKK